MKKVTKELGVSQAPSQLVAAGLTWGETTAIIAHSDTLASLS